MDNKNLIYECNVQSFSPYIRTEKTERLFLAGKRLKEKIGYDPED